MSLGTLGGVACRFAISRCLHFSIAKTLTFNALDILISGLAVHRFINKRGYNPNTLNQIKGASWLAATAITVLLLGSTSFSKTLILSMSAFAVGFLIDVVLRKGELPQEYAIY